MQTLKVIKEKIFHGSVATKAAEKKIADKAEVAEEKIIKNA
jgi:hypothetical protein